MAGREAATAAREAALASREAAVADRESAALALARAAPPAPVASAGDVTPSKEEKKAPSKEEQKAAIAIKVEELLKAAKQRAAQVPKSGSRPKTIVLTGGPGVGKTTLIDYVQKELGCTVVPVALSFELGTVPI